jgi:hypothetical protein
MLERTDSPSYGAQLARGATALTEAWDADPNSSQDHFMLGHAEEWFYRGLAGIDLDFSRDGAERLVLRPEAVGDVQWVRAKYRSALGVIQSEWKREGGETEYTFVVPEGSAATIEVRADSAAAVTVNGMAGSRAREVESARGEAGRVRIAVSSGRYVVRAKNPAH